MIAECIQNPITFFANSLNKAFEGEINHKTLTRILVSRSEFDLADIKKEYERAFNRKLGSDVKVSNINNFCHVGKKRYAEIISEQNIRLLQEDSWCSYWRSLDDKIHISHI